MAQFFCKRFCGKTGIIYFMKILEAVPNISEGQNRPVLDEIFRRVEGACGAQLLHTDSNPDANRTVLTLAGTPREVRQSLLALYQATGELLDMRTQHGAHPRLGAVDVCPLVPVADMTLSEAAQEARTLGQAVAKMGLPVYFYEQNASSPVRRNLAFLRRGEYESLPQKLAALPPDLGPQNFSPVVAKTGATVIGARNFLIAFNMSLSTQDVSAAKEIAAVLREKNGGLKAVKAIGWYMPAYHAAQVSCNLTDFHQTGLAGLFEACQREAAKRGLKVTAGELIGLAPREALLQAGQFYAPHETDETALIAAAAEQLKLNEIRPFIPGERILEERLKLLQAGK